MSFIPDTVVFNARVENWGRANLVDLKQSIRTLKKGNGIPPAGHKPLEANLKDKYGKVNGEIVRITYGVQRHGIFWRKGVGKGYKMNGGTVVRTGGGPINRTPANWFNPVLDKNIDALATLKGNQIAAAAVNYSNALIT
jgi:hypothetical protein